MCVILLRCVQICHFYRTLFRGLLFFRTQCRMVRTRSKNDKCCWRSVPLNSHIVRSSPVSRRSFVVLCSLSGGLLQSCAVFCGLLRCLVVPLEWLGLVPRPTSATGGSSVPLNGLICCVTNHLLSYAVLCGLSGGLCSPVQSFVVFCSVS